MSYPQPPQGPPPMSPVPAQAGPHAMTPPPYPPQVAPGPRPATPWYFKKWFVVVMLIIFFPVGLVLCWLSPETKLVGRVVWSVLWGFFLLMRIAGGGNSASTGPSTSSSTPASQPVATPVAQPVSAPVANAAAPATKPAPAPAPAPARKAPQWNTSDLNTESNGNMRVAVDLLKDLAPATLRQEADGTIAAATVNKQPWKYYGKPLKLTGAVAIAQAYPPDSDIGKVVGGEAAEIVMVGEDGTIIDFFMMGDTGDVNVNDVATVYGYVIGHAEVQNKMGGQTTQMIIVGKAIQKGP